MVIHNITNPYKVDLSNLVEFTETHLDLHKSFFNKQTHPEFFIFPDMGLEYEDTILEESVVLNSKQSKLMKQGMRKGSNSKYNGIKHDIKNGGFDLRGKCLHVVYDENDNPLCIFGGNTNNTILLNETNVQNRIVHKFRATKNFSMAKLIQIGGRLNSLDLTVGPISWEDVVYIIRQLIKEREIALPRNPTHKDKEKFGLEIAERISFIANERYNSSKKGEISSLIIELEESITGQKTLSTVKKGIHLLDALREKSNQFEDNAVSRWIAYSSNFDKVLYGFGVQYGLAVKDWSEKVEGAIDPNLISWNMIIHFGTPDPTNELSYLRDKFQTFISDEENTMTLLNEVYYHQPVKTNRCNIFGFHNPSKLVEELSGGEIKLDEVYPKEVWVKFFKNNP
jgi:hypothetical protein